jgi:hypothetical protein
METWKKILILILSLMTVIFIWRKAKKKPTGKGLSMSKRVRRINMKQKRQIPLSFEERMFVWQYSSPANNSRRRRFKFFAPITTKPTISGGAVKRRRK